MLFLISLVIAFCFAWFCGGLLRRYPAPFYITALLLSIWAACLTALHINDMPAFLRDWVFGQLTKGTLATACWAVVMWTGALKNGSPAIKRLMPARGQLSIFAALLTLGHAVGYGISYLPRWLQKADWLDFTICVVLMCIMLPLTVISVQKIRRKMKGKTWKMWQRFAYLFYALIPAHVIALNFVRAKNGRTDAIFNVAVYLAVFLGYAVWRLRKLYLTKHKDAARVMPTAAALAGFLLPMCAVMIAVLPQKDAERTVTADTTPAAQTDAVPAETTTTTAETTAASAAGETTTSAFAQTADTTAETTSAETATTSAAAADTTAPAETALSSTESTPAETAPPQTEPSQTAPAQTEPPQTEPAAPKIYRDGTYSASAFGYDGEITVHVTIQNDAITAITAETDEADDTYFFDAKKVMLPAIIAAQSPDVDGVSGATFSSNAIIAAVRKALDAARV